LSLLLGLGVAMTALSSEAALAAGPEGEWLVRVMASKEQFVFGVYRRHMKTIGYLGQIDKLFGVRATTRNWNTIIAIVQILKGDDKKAKRD